MREYIDHLTSFELASFRRYLRKKGYSESTIDDIVFNLNTILKRYGKVLTPEELREKCWRDSVYSRKNLMWAVRKYYEYRKKLEND